MRRIYLDNAATTPVLPEVVDVMLPWLREQHGNPSSTHAYGRDARVAVERAREQVAAMIGADPREIVFTAGGTESDNAALHMALYGTEDPSSVHIISSGAEHHAVHMPLELLSRRGARVELIPVDAGGAGRVADIRAAIGADTVLCSLMHVNNETGAVLPLEEVGALLRQHDVLFHSDIVQSAGKLAVDVHAAHVDFAAMSAHKIHGPKGVGALYVRNGVNAEPFLVGGGQERGRRGGTENVAGIVAFGEAARIATRDREARLARWSSYRTRFRERLLDAFPDLHINQETDASALPNILSVSFPAASYAVDGAMLLMSCDLAGVAVSGGSACASGSVQASHVMRAIGHDEETGAAALRISFGATTSEEDVEEGSRRVLGVLREMLRR